jgi:hypothetical protein
MQDVLKVLTVDIPTAVKMSVIYAEKPIESI